MKPLDERQLSTYLHYGYFPRLPAEYRNVPWARVRRDELLPLGAVPRDELVRRGLAAFRAACIDPGPGPHVVPLSGGIDSRFLLATLLESVPRERIVAVTFGVPGALDFELAARVAQVARVTHEALDLTALPAGEEELLATTRRVPWCFTFEAHFNHEIQRRHGPDATYWSGIMANVTIGKDLDYRESDWPAACREFAGRSRLLRGRDLAAPGFDPAAVLPERPPLEDNALAWLEQLYAFVRFPGRLDPALLAAGYRWRTPFRAPAWVDFMLRAPRELRADPSFYREIAASSAPDLFALATKNDLGLAPGASRARRFVAAARHKLVRQVTRRLPGRTRVVNPSLNYADLDREVRAASPLGRAIIAAVERLAARDLVPWLDPRALLARHRARRENLGEHLALLAALELNLACDEAGTR